MPVLTGTSSMGNRASVIANVNFWRKNQQKSRLMRYSKVGKVERWKGGKVANRPIAHLLHALILVDSGCATHSPPERIRREVLRSS
jgi:hypothetical protein